MSLRNIYGLTNENNKLMVEYIGNTAKLAGIPVNKVM